MKNIRVLTQLLTVLCIASFAGSMLMLYTSLVPYWKQLSPADFLEWFSAHSGGIETTTGPFVKLVMLLPILTIYFTWKTKASRIYWLISYLFIIGIMVITFSFFIGANTSFVNQTIEMVAVKETVNTWAQLHLVRIALGFLSTIFAAIGIFQYFKKNRRDPV